MREQVIICSAKTKLADVLSSNPNVLPIIERLDMKLGFGDATVSDVCKMYGLSTELFITICNIYSVDNFQPALYVLKKGDLIRLISYLRSSHKYYSEKCFPYLHSCIHAMMEDCDTVNNKIINKFYDEYDADVKNHFDYEETVVFPYIEALVSGKKTDYSISLFKEKHSDIDEKLNDLKNIIIKYLPATISSSIRFEVLNSIFMVEKDLRNHTLIENKLLIPLVSKIEKDE